MFKLRRTDEYGSAYLTATGRDTWEEAVIDAEDMYVRPDDDDVYNYDFSRSHDEPYDDNDGGEVFIVNDSLFWEG